MRKIRLYQITVALITVALGLFLIQCNIVDPQKGLEVRLNTISRTTTVTMFFYDAVSQKTIQGNLTATFKGDNASKVIDVNNNSKTQFTATKGFITFSINDETQISKDNPLVLILNASAGGYQSYASKVTLYSTGFINKSVFMTSTTTAPPNTVEQTAQSGSTDNSGTVTDTVNVKTENGTSITLDPGTQMKDASGNPVSGNITTTITTIPVTGANSNIASQDFRVNSTTIAKPGLIFTIQMQNQSGQTVSTINSSKKIPISIPLPHDLNYQPGDLLYIYTIDQNTGEPVQVGELTVGGTSGSMRKVSSIMQIPGNGNISPFLIIGGIAGGAGLIAYAVSQNQNNTCTGSFLQSATVESHTFDLYRFSNGVPILFGPVSSSDLFQGTISLDEGDTYILKYGTIEVSSQFTASCGTNIITIDQSKLPKTYTISFAGKGVCKNTDPLTIGNLSSASYIYWKKGDNVHPHSGSISGGSGSISLEAGTYTFSVSYQDNTYEGDVTVGSNGELSSSFDTSGLYYGPIKINGKQTTLTKDNNPNIDGESVTVYFGINCD